MSVEFTPKPTIEIPKSLFKEFGQENVVAKSWKTLVIDDHIITLNEIIGLGCQGTVYDGESNQYGNVAVKELRKISDDVIQDIACRIGVGPEIFDLAYEKDMTYMVFEKLDRMICYKDIYDAQIAVQLCEAITLLIENGIFHNDIRETNIMLDFNGTLKIIDYDSAVLAFIDDPDTVIRKPLITLKDYDLLLQKNYNIVLNEKKYTIAFPIEMQERHLKARKNFENLLLSNFILGLGF
jgi:serine/threonine protein kinase